jgi:glycolate oxidase
MNARAYEEIEAIVGPENITADEQICDTYAQHLFHRPDPNIWICRPMAVVLPATTEEVSGFIKVCNKHKIKYKAHSTGYGAHSGASSPDVVLVDLRRMNRIVEIDEKNMIAVIEPYVSGGELQRMAWKKGLTLCVTTAGPQSSVLASITSHQGGSCAGASMGYNGRNMFACEWVSPAGEIVRVGSNGNGDGWFSADGPGPSLKAFIRGYFGFDGAMGIFTKAAVKLYHWAGMREYKIANDGQLYEADVEVPENMHFYTLLTDSWENTEKAYYQLAETELCTYMNKFSVGVTGWGYMPAFFEKAVKLPHLREALKMGRHRTVIVVVGNSKRDLEYKVDCLKQIAENTGGILFGGRAETPYRKAHLCSLCKADGYASLFNGPGTFHVAMGADESIAVVMKQAQYAQEIKERMIEQGLTADDLGDGAWVGIYDQSSKGHNEATMIFDPTDPVAGSSMGRYSAECADVLYNKHLGGIGFAAFGGKEQVEMFNDAASDYYKHTVRIKEILDPDNLANMTFV